MAASTDPTVSKSPLRHLDIDPWIIRETGFHEDRSEASESVFALANEVTGARGYFEEGYSGKSSPGVFFNGVFEEKPILYTYAFKGFPTRFTYMVNTADWLHCRIRWDGELLDLAQVRHESFVREVDLREGVLRRKFTWLREDGRRLDLRFERLLSMEHPDCGAQRVTFLSPDAAASVDVEFGMDFGMIHLAEERSLWKVKESTTDKNRLGILGQTETTGQLLALSCRFTGLQDARAKESDTGISLVATIAVPAGKETSIVRIAHWKVCRTPGGDGDALLSETAEAAATAAHTWDSLAASQRAFWDQVWEQRDIEVGGDAENQQGIRFCISHLTQTYHGVDSANNVGAKGLTGEFYWGCAWWDTETYCMPFYLFNDVAAAKNFIGYRHRTLPGAIERGQQLGDPGARYPMCTIDGTEMCPVWQHGDLEIHVSAAVSYAIWLFDHLEDDANLLADMGTEILVEVARFYAARGAWGAVTGKFGYWGVMGADEMHMMVNNNAYTNVMGQKSMRWAADVMRRMRNDAPETFAHLTEKLGLTEDEMADWEHKAAETFTGHDPGTGLWEQHEGYFNMPFVDPHQIRPEELPVNKVWPYLHLFRSSLIKQPDVLLLSLFFSHEWDEAALRANFNYYEPRCCHESSLSPSVHSVLAARLGYDAMAYEYARFASRIDLDDYNRNTYQGLHVTSMAGSWMNFVMGFGGLRFDGPCLQFDPSLPGAWTSLRYRLQHRGRSLRISIDSTTCTVELLSGEELPIEVCGNSHTLRPDQPLTVSTLSTSATQ
ncbi:MAG: glycosyl hydrolase family 65 protein [Opitutales bacterium]